MRTKEYVFTEIQREVRAWFEREQIKPKAGMVNSVSDAYVFVHRALWLKVNDYGRFFNRYEQIAQAYIAFKEQYPAVSQETLLYTFRQVYMNAKTKKVMTSYKNLALFMSKQVYSINLLSRKKSGLEVRKTL